MVSNEGHFHSFIASFRCTDDNAWKGWNWTINHGSRIDYNIDYSGNYYDQYYVALVGAFRFLPCFFVDNIVYS